MKMSFAAFGITLALAVAHGTESGTPTPGPAASKDVIFRLSGGVLAGRIFAFDHDAIRMEVDVIPGQPPGRIAVPRANILRIEFAEDPEAEALLAARNLSQFDAIEAHWLKRRPTLSIEGSNAGEFGLATAELLLDRARSGDRERALQLFELIEREDWFELRKSSARGGRLKAMVLLGRANEAIEEARQVLSQTEDPGVLIESHHVLGEASFAALKKLVEENPRWREDLFVRPDYDRLLNEALDHYLFAPLFHGSVEEAAARGLWAAGQVLAFHGAFSEQKKLANDITALYPRSSFVNQALSVLSDAPKPPSRPAE